MINLKAGNISLADMESLLFLDHKMTLDQPSMEKVEECFRFLDEFSRDKIIYGINTGFGPMAQYRIETHEIQQLQYNLIRSHSVGTGKMLPPVYVKAAMLARIGSLLRGYSGIHPSVINLLANLVNDDIYPVIFEHGGVGASGDLVQLASDILARRGLQAISMHIREGLALANGTSVMTGIGIVNILKAQKLLDWATWASAAICEIIGSFNDHFSDELNQVKGHRGQMAIAREMQRITNGSKCIRKREEHFYNGNKQENIFTDKVQEYYSLRCVPQILGPVYDTLQNVSDVLVTELNSVNDNPVIDIASKNVYHGGNFHGDYVSLEMDKLKIAITKLTMLAERQLNYLMHDRINNLLPAFVNLGKLGLNYGMQAMQFTATSTTAECQMLANPMYIHSISNNNDNQDIVSMGTNAANITRTVIDNAFQVLAIEMMAIVQAVEYLKIGQQLSPVSQMIVGQIRELSPAFVDDAPRYLEIQKLVNFLQESKILIQS